MLVQWNIFAQILAIACVLVPNIFDISQGFAGVVDQCTLKLKKKPHRHATILRENWAERSCEAKLQVESGLMSVGSQGC